FGPAENIGPRKRPFAFAGSNIQNETSAHLVYNGASLTGTKPKGFCSGSKSKPLSGLLKRDKAEGFALARGGAAR
ncbi:hypothetical protein, partial [Rhizobium sp. Rhizsp42]|uniref:hypothetical protein n=1 Tax=Rhizobium sp. Rhizsp42 TaxID=3243034 RepID=UPI0039AF0C53